MSLKLTTLDGRNLGYPLFKYSVALRYNPDSDEDFVKVRQWCWNNFGPSMELDLWLDARYTNVYLWLDAIHKDQKPSELKWSWHAPRSSIANNRPLPRIYLATDRQASEFIMQWA